MRCGQATAGLGRLGGEVWLQIGIFWRHPLGALSCVILPVVLLPLLNAIYPNVRVVLSRHDVTGRVGWGGELVSLEEYLVPTLAAFGVATACYASLGLRVAVARAQGVLARVWLSPLPPGVYVAGWLGAAVVVGLAVAFTTATIGWMLYGVMPQPDQILLAGASLLLGSVAFCALGLATVASVRNAQTAPAVVLTLLFPMVIVSNVFYVPGQAPTWLSRIGELLPLEPFRGLLVDVYAPALTLETKLVYVLILGTWGLVGCFVAARAFTWLPRR